MSPYRQVEKHSQKSMCQFGFENISKDEIIEFDEIKNLYLIILFVFRKCSLFFCVLNHVLVDE